MPVLVAVALLAPSDRVVYEGSRGPGKGMSIVFLTGDEEYRSEEGLPQLAKILADRLGFKCTVLFSVNAAGEIDPNTKNNEPGMEALDSADLCVMLLRFRQWPDEQMKHFVNYYESGKPILALRTSTHAFDYPETHSDFGPRPLYERFSWQNQIWPGGFGKQVLGETWVSHWGDHGHQATRAVPADPPNALLNGVQDVFVTTDVYEASPPADATILLRGQVLSGMNPTDPSAIGRKKTANGTEQDINDPMMPIAWTRERKNEAGKTNRIFTTTMGAATDLLNPGLRRLLVNGVFWCLGKKTPEKANVDLVGNYNPSRFGFNAFRTGVRPADLGEH